VKAPPSGKSVTVSIDKDLGFYLNKAKLEETNLPNALATALKGNPDPTIVIQAEHTVAVENVVKVMAIGKKMNAKVLLATDPE
jgi:biopolymer transport protein ExbD